MPGITMYFGDHGGLPTTLSRANIHMWPRISARFDLTYGGGPGSNRAVFRIGRPAIQVMDTGATGATAFSVCRDARLRGPSADRAMAGCHAGTAASPMPTRGSQTGAGERDGARSPGGIGPDAGRGSVPSGELTRDEGPGASSSRLRTNTGPFRRGGTSTARPHCLAAVEGDGLQAWRSRILAASRESCSAS